MRTEKSEERAGYRNGLMHYDPIPDVSTETAEILRLENLRKANNAVSNPNTRPLVRAYWQGYLEGMRARENAGQLKQ